MPHSQFCRRKPGSDTAVLFVHGILGTPDHFRDFVPIAAEKYTVCSLLLDGHGQGVREFSNSSMEKWRAQTERAAEELLRTHRFLIIMAHSMGTLFAIEQACLHPDRIRFLFLLDAPLRLRLRPAMVRNAGKVYFNRIRPEDKEGMAVKQAYSIQNDWRIWRYLGWIPRYLELFREIRNVRAMVPSMTVPCYVFQSGRDEMVSPEAGKEFSGNARTVVCTLPSSSHDYYPPEDYQLLLSEFSRLIHKENRPD